MTTCTQCTKLTGSVKYSLDVMTLLCRVERMQECFPCSNTPTFRDRWSVFTGTRNCIHPGITQTPLPVPWSLSHSHTDCTHLDPVLHVDESGVLFHMLQVLSVTQVGRLPEITARTQK